MRAVPKTILGDLADWDLPSREGRICDLIEELKPKRIRLTVDEITFGDLLDGLLYDRVREIGATAANEAIFGWLAVASIDSASERRDTAARLASRLRAVADKLQRQPAGPE